MGRGGSKPIVENKSANNPAAAAAQGDEDTLKFTPRLIESLQQQNDKSENPNEVKRQRELQAAYQKGVFEMRKYYETQQMQQQNKLQQQKQMSLTEMNAKSISEATRFQNDSITKLGTIENNNVSSLMEMMERVDRLISVPESGKQVNCAQETVQTLTCLKNAKLNSNLTSHCLDLIKSLQVCESKASS